jgi:hypothetical protein
MNALKPRATFQVLIIRPIAVLAFRVLGRLANRASADDALDLPVAGALFSAVRVAVGALEDAAGAFVPSGHRSASPGLQDTLPARSCQYASEPVSRPPGRSRHKSQTARFVAVFVV